MTYVLKARTKITMLISLILIVQSFLFPFRLIFQLKDKADQKTGDPRQFLLAIGLLLFAGSPAIILLSLIVVAILSYLSFYIFVPLNFLRLIVGLIFPKLVHQNRSSLLICCLTLDIFTYHLKYLINFMNPDFDWGSIPFLDSNESI